MRQGGALTPGEAFLSVCCQPWVRNDIWSLDCRRLVRAVSSSSSIVGQISYFSSTRWFSALPSEGWQKRLLAGGCRQASDKLLYMRKCIVRLYLKHTEQSMFQDIEILAFQCYPQRTMERGASSGFNWYGVIPGGAGRTKQRFFLSMQIPIDGTWVSFTAPRVWETEYICGQGHR